MFNPAESLDVLEWVIEDIDLILIMSVNPGFGGQSYIPAVTEKVRQVDQHGMYTAGAGHALGLAFQVIDDILDVTQSTEMLGKTAGKDQAVEKSTYPAILGLDASRKEAARLTKAAMDALKPFGTKAARLEEIASHLLKREY